MLTRLLFFALSVFAVPVLSIAECNQAEDPCAPKKALDDWQKSLSFGFNYTSGNSDTSLLTILGALARETQVDLWNFDTAYSFGEDRDQDAPEDDDETTRNDFRANALYRYFLSEPWYTGAIGKFLYDEIADVDYRVNAAPIVGLYLLKDADVTLNLDVGPGYLFERVGGLERNYFAPRVGQGFGWVISCTSKIFERADVTFDINDSENYLITAEGGIETAINSSLGLVVSVRDTYDNQPAEGTKQNDLAIITALKVAI